MEALQFSKAGLEEIESEFKNVEIIPEVREVLNGVAEILAKCVPISELALRGFILFSLKGAQQDLKVKVKDMKTMEPKIKRAFIKTVFGNIENRLAKILQDKSAENMQLLHDACEQAYQYRISQHI